MNSLAGAERTERKGHLASALNPTSSERVQRRVARSGRSLALALGAAESENAKPSLRAPSFGWLQFSRAKAQARIGSGGGGAAAAISSNTGYATKRLRASATSSCCWEQPTERVLDVANELSSTRPLT